MLSNNQGKTKQIKTISHGHGHQDKKSRGKDALRSSQSKKIHTEAHSKNKGKTLKPKQQQSSSKSKEKNKQTRIVHQEYYIEQKRVQKIRPMAQYQRHKKSKSNTKCVYDSSDKDPISVEKGIQGSGVGFQKIQKLSFPEQTNVITFDGKVIKLPPKEQRPAAYHNYTSLSGYKDDHQFTNEVLKERKIKLKSNEKKNKNLLSKAVLKTKFKANQKHCRSQQSIQGPHPFLSQFQTEIHKVNLIEDTQNSPTKEIDYQRPQKFDFEQIYELIDQDLRACNEVRITKQAARSRKQCIKFMSEICGELSLRRQTFYLSISIYDRAINTKMTIQNHKLLTLVCVTLAMKLQQARLSQQFVYALGVVNSGKESYLESVTSCKSTSKPKSITARSSNKKSSQTNSSKKWKQPKITIKEQNIRKIGIGPVAKLLRRYGCSKILKYDFMELQQKVTVYLRFRVWRIQAVFWVDLLTCLWDQHIITNQQFVNCHSSLLFRCSASLMNISFLYQILQMAYQNENIYSYPSVYVVLSAMYLLVRITKENNENGYQFYRQSLANSTNIIFVDKTGINQIYWIFLDRLKIQMVQLISCCQFISQFLHPEIMKSTISTIETRQSIDSNLSIHEYNPDLYIHNT